MGGVSEGAQLALSSRTNTVPHPPMRHRLYYHIVWTTRDRRPLIDRDAAVFLWHFLDLTARAERGAVLEIGMVRTHVHVLVALHPCAVIPRLMQRMKGASAVVINREYHPGAAPDRFGWAAGYNIETVSPRSLPQARDYVRRQPEHHPSEAILNWAPPTRPYPDGP